MEQMNTSDHDLLIRVDTRLGDLKQSVDSIRDGVNSKIENHEYRIQKLELSRSNLKLQLGIYISIGAVLIGLLIWHMTGKGL